ncbi:hypothetical protein PLICRDRAFT_699563 [Plicaturopsis crispa FD-325 SS-3]|nr:hypothetical protein PLICRDRAFT_699563 [Plicaturopsis crispa FD-325 SS-3]
MEEDKQQARRRSIEIDATRIWAPRLNFPVSDSMARSATATPPATTPNCSSIAMNADTRRRKTTGKACKWCISLIMQFPSAHEQYHSLGEVPGVPHRSTICVLGRARLFTRSVSRTTPTAIARVPRYRPTIPGHIPFFRGVPARERDFLA